MSTETLALASEVDRILAHLPCLERAAADLSAPLKVRRAVRAQIAVSRTVLALLGADLPNGSERNRTNLNGPGCGTHQDRTESNA